MALDPSITAALASLRERRDALNRAIEALLALDNEDHSPAAHAQPSQAVSGEGGIPSAEAFGVATGTHVEGGGAAGARKVLRAAPGRGFTAYELAEAMTANGWRTPSKNRPAAARAAGNRLREDPTEHVFFQDGKFIYRPPSTELEGLRESTQEDGGRDAAA